ncbi:MAG: homoserine dehydrogenase [Gammaproteobacteria bacterium]|nr:homoserine dehydrogenase [Gammaproteobacteria bacterium]
MEPVKIGIIGLGTVGCGTVEVLARNADEIARRAGRGIHTKIVAVRDLGKPRGCDVAKLELTSDPFAVVDHPDIQIVVELMGGNDLARELVLKSISNGKHVVTANKSLIAEHGNQIFAEAQAQGVTVAFEAAVGGGISIIKVIREGLAGNRIEWLAGIVNGTANYVLTGMRDQGRDFQTMLREAQRLGYAEADPAFDIDGVDAAHKLTILAAIAFGIPLQFDKVYTEGISELTREDILYADELGYRVKHLALAIRTSDGIELRVHPCLVPNTRLIANVEGVMNALVVKGDAVGETLHYGAGAGAEPTASAVVADLVDVVRVLTSDPNNRVPHLAFQPGALADLPILPMADVKTAYYLRMNALNRAGVLAEITRILGDLEISIEAVLQKRSREGESTVPVIMLTQPTLERYMDQALQQIESLPAIAGKVMRIRVEGLQ